MPSKKKNSKTPSKLSNSDPNSDFSSSPAVSTSISSTLNSSNEQLLSSLDKASAKFPSLISRTAFIGTVVDTVVPKDSKPRLGMIWLPESAMGPSIYPGSHVSVSLYSMDKSVGGFPLSALSDEYARNFGFDLADNLADEAGNYFAIAAASASREVSENGVRLSEDLSYTLGCPTSGRTIFVCPVECNSSSENGNDKRCGLTASCISLDNCKELYLSPVYLKGKVEKEGALLSHLDLFEKESNGQIVNSEISSLKTPSLSMSKLSSSRLPQSLGHDSSRKCLETCIRSCLNRRRLLSGNFVRVPIPFRHYVFQVVGSKRLLPNSESMNSKNYDLSSRDPNAGKDMVHAFVLNLGTKIHFLLLGNPMVETLPNNSLAYPEHGLGHNKDSIGVNFPKLGGLSKEFAVLKDIIVSSTAQVTVASLGLRPTKGLLLHGPPGTGKTALARVCAHDAGVTMFSVNGPEIIDQYHGKTEEALHEMFNEASKASPAVVFIDELDAIAPARKEGGDDLSHRIVATLLNLMDGIGRTNGVLIIAATNRPDSIDPALRRPGRLDKEIEIGVPSPGQRHEILLLLLSEMNHSLSDKDIENLAMASHGFVGADLATLCNQAALVRLRQYVKSTTNHGEAALSCTSEAHNSSDTTDGIGINKTCDLEDTLKITSGDFEKASVRVRPSAMREINLEVPKVCWEDVGGQMEVKMQLMEAVQWPQKHKDSFERIGTRPPRGILLFGPPGCSKTLLARAVASEAGLNFLAVKGPELFSKWVGESEKAVRSLFVKARANAPSIIFVDEIDGLAAIRGQESDGISVGDRVISQLLVELDGLQQRGSVTVVAATNRPDNIDPALLRPGRFDRLIYVGPPNRKDREEIFHVHLRWKPCSSDVCISELALLTEGCTGADIYHICREASMKAMEENFSASEITMEHLKFGIKQVEPSDVRMYETLSAKFQRLVHSTAKEEDDLSREPCSDKQSHISFWTRVRWALLFLFRLPGLNLLSSSS